MEMDGEQMIRTIALNKEKDREEAKKAFILFCGCYEVRATQMALTLCERWKKPESDAYQIVECAFEKIWLYPSFEGARQIARMTIEPYYGGSTLFLFTS